MNTIKAMMALFWSVATLLLLPFDRVVAVTRKDDGNNRTRGVLKVFLENVIRDSVVYADDPSGTELTGAMVTPMSLVQGFYDQGFDLKGEQKIPFQRLVREIAQDFKEQYSRDHGGDTLSIDEAAMAMLGEASELWVLDRVVNED